MKTRVNKSIVHIVVHRYPYKDTRIHTHAHSTAFKTIVMLILHICTRIFVSPVDRRRQNARDRKRISRV